MAPPPPPPKPAKPQKPPVFLRVSENSNYEFSRPAPPVPTTLKINKTTKLVPVSSFGSSSPVGAQGSFDSILKEMKQIQRNGSLKGSFRNSSRGPHPPTVQPKIFNLNKSKQVTRQDIFNKYNQSKINDNNQHVSSPSRSSSVTSAYATDFSQSVQAQVAKFNSQINDN